MTEMAALKSDTAFDEEADTFEFDLMIREYDGMVLTTSLNEHGVRV